jgi:hypothetical protein
MKVAELTGAKLDYWVYHALNGKHLADFTGGTVPYSSDWAWGGPIIEREEIEINVSEHRLYAPDGKTLWAADWYPKKGKQQDCHSQKGSSALEAAMRCYVASEFGEEVPDEPTR